MKPFIPIADYRWKYLVYTGICSVIAVAGFLTFNAKERHWQFWMAEIVMCGFALGLLYILFSPKYIFIGRKGPKYDEWIQKQYQELLDHNGKFKYTEDGFLFVSDTGEIEILWNQITRISAHLEDGLGNDEDLCIKLDYGTANYIEFDEEVDGWLAFALKIRDVFSLSADWQEKLLQSDLKEMVLYKKS